MTDNETIKHRSGLLRGTLAEQLAEPKTHFDEDGLQLLKFHGSYQQDDRDRRRAAREAGEEKAYQFMIRSRIPGGVLTAGQYLVHDELADRYGNGSLRFTTRQGIQLHGVVKANLRASIRAINDALLTTLAACGDVNRNVMTCPAPARTRAAAAAQAFAVRIAEHLTPRSRAYHEIWLDGEKLARPEEEPIYGPAYLPRKFKIAVALPGDNCLDVFTQDLGFVAEANGDELTGFTVLVGGGMGSTHGKSETFPRLATPLCFVTPADVVRVAEAVVTLHRDYGDRTNRKHARLKYVVEERGIGWVRAEVERRAGTRFDDPHDVAFPAVDDHLGWHRQLDGRWFLGVWIESGRVADRVRSLTRSALRAVVRERGAGIRITAQQNVLLTGIPASARASVEATFRDHGVEIDPHRLGIARDALACPALPTCGLAVAEAERALPGIVAAIERELIALGLQSERLSVRMTGCPNGCARPRMGDIGIVGRSLDLYDVFVGGDRSNTRLNVPFAQGVRREAIAAALRPALQRWADERYEGEPLGDFAHRTGPARATPVLPAARR